jgi:hypothetical protein
MIRDGVVLPINFQFQISDHSDLSLEETASKMLSEVQVMTKIMTHGKYRAMQAYHIQSIPMHLDPDRVFYHTN